jgi:hypothetical protein
MDYGFIKTGPGKYIPLGYDHSNISTKCIRWTSTGGTSVPLLYILSDTQPAVMSLLPATIAEQAVNAIEKQLMGHRIFILLHLF